MKAILSDCLIMLLLYESSGEGQPLSPVANVCSLRHMEHAPDSEQRASYGPLDEESVPQKRRITPFLQCI